MAAMEIKTFDRPEERMTFPKGRDDKLTLGGRTVSRAVLEPGWRFSVDVKELAGSEWCMAPHTLYVASGRLGVRMQDGTEGELGPGALAVIPPGHDGWVIGDEPCVSVDFTGGKEFGKPQ